MKMAPGAIPNPGRVPEQELMSPGLGFLVAAELRCVSGENLRCSLIFRSGANIYAKGRREAVEEGSRWDPHTVDPGPWPGATWRLWARPELVLLAPGVFCRNKISVIFWEFSEHFGFWTFSAMHRHNKQKLALGILSIG